MSKKSSSSSSLALFNDASLLFEWASHQDDSYHDFSPEEAEQIRSSLLTWYHANRRKLPWRGDPPPYDGSTAGINTSSKAAAKKKGKKAWEEAGQSSIKSFFASNSGATAEKEPSSTDADGAVVVVADLGVRLPVSAYGVWVSEIMLQQTRVEAVIPFYLKWMDTFPTVEHLAKASEEQVNAHWAGLGFYRRARFLHQGAQLVVETYGGELPDNVEELMKITGIGQYTASAVASIAFRKCVPVVDGNVCRVLSRLRGIAHHIKAPILKDKLGWRLAEQIVQAGDGTDAGDVNQALMELGATYCAPGGNGMDDNDPLKSYYLSTKLAENFEEEHTTLSNRHGFENFPTDAYLNVAAGSDSKKCCALCDNKSAVLTGWNDAFTQGSFEISHGPFPLAPPKASKREEVLAVAVLRNSQDDKWLLVKRPKTGLLAGQWEFPAVCVWSSADDKPTKGKKKRKDVDVPFIKNAVRSEALTNYLDALAPEEEPHESILSSGERTALPDSIEHIFSHVRHTMWIEHKSVSSKSITSTTWVSGDDKEVRWMSKVDMEKVGVTSGVKKILKAVESLSRTPTSKKRSKRKL